MGGAVPFLKLTVLATAFAFGYGSSDNVSPARAELVRGSHQESVPKHAKGGHYGFFPLAHSPTKAPAPHAAKTQVHISKAHVVSPAQHHHHTRMWTHGFSSTPEISHHKHHHPRKPLTWSKGLAYKSHLRKHHGSVVESRSPSVSPTQHRFSSSTRHHSPSPAPSPSFMISSGTMLQPSPSPPGSYTSGIHSSPIMTFPPPPPDEDCMAVTCTKPFTSTPVGYPCACVQPFQVRVFLDIALYSFFPLVSELTSEIATSLSLNHSQVRVMGADAASQWLDKTISLIDLVPLEEKFDDAVAFSIYEKLLHKQVYINPSLFGTYKVLQVHYPGLPTSPPSKPPDFASVEEPLLPFNGENGDSIKPLGVEVPRLQKKRPMGIMIGAVVLSSITVFIACLAATWIVVLKRRKSATHLEDVPPSMSSLTKLSGVPRSLSVGSGPQSVSSSCGTLSFSGTAKIFSISEMERATDGFDSSRVIGEGGFGVVYGGILDDGEKVAVKVLKRDDRQGAREFLAEVEMLSRLHHRNLVKLIGICREEHFRCLVYELVPNGSVESHLHGFHKEIAPLDWETRMKIALGAARGLAYLHEDSSPCVIHCDFKSSNILLEHDYTPKVSDFGLARAALDGRHRRISTQVMGTFGYLAPEYAMTGHLLVKSDVYSYGVVLLELLTGRKPVEFSQPQGQANLVAWARPFLTNKEALETIIDPTLGSTVPLDSLSNVAAIASMCVSAEVSRRPFMGEVVQALKLVCREFDDPERDADGAMGSSSRVLSDLSVGGEFSGEARGFSNVDFALPCGRDLSLESMIELSTSNMKSEMVHSGSLRRHFSSGSLGVEKKRRFWQRFSGFTGKCANERGASSAWPASR